VNPKLKLYSLKGEELMAIFVGILIAIVGAYVAFLLSTGKSKKRKYIVWGIILMLLISPSISFAMGLSFAVITKSGWSALVMLYIFPIMFLAGLIVFFIGLFEKKTVH